MMFWKCRCLLFAGSLIALVRKSETFAPLHSRGALGQLKGSLPISSSVQTPQDHFSSNHRWSITQLEAKKKRKRRRRKQPPNVASEAPDTVKVSEQPPNVASEVPDAVEVAEQPPSVVSAVPDAVEVSEQPPNVVPAVPDAVKVSEEKVEGLKQDESFDNGSDTVKEESAPEDLLQMKDVANFEFESDSAITIGIQDENRPTNDPDEVIPLPDIRDELKRKKVEEKIAAMELEKEESKPKIKRSDTEAFKKLLEQSPFNDADDSLFEEEKYNAVSAILGERAKPFLSIPLGPLQIGHFIGALAIVLMAFVEYPGFPLTNLPTPLRDALKGGLASVYAINVVLAVLAAFKAGERGQPIPLWVSKTLAVGGLAYDQLTQLPTLEEVKAAEAQKGKRALKNRKR